MKKLLTFILYVLLVVMVVACTENVSAIGGDDIDDSNPIIDSVDDPQPIELNPVVADPDPEPVVTPDPQPDPEPQIDPNEQLTWDYLEVDEAWMKNYRGIGLRRDGKLYSLTDGVPKENSSKTTLGAVHNNNATSGGFGEEDSSWILNDDRYVIPVVSGTDDIGWYGESDGSIKLLPMEFYGYTIPMITNASVNNWSITAVAWMEDPRGSQDYANLKSIYYKDLKLFDSNGIDHFELFRESLDNSELRNLNYNEKYSLEWDSDGEHYQKDLVAFWRYYRTTGADAITLSGEPTDDENYEKYDFSTVPSGVYYIVESYVLIQVDND